ncbi:MAG: sigma-70 family RNA polymerase sigma factor [Parcubacteria group bacterium]|nr:sigma-70 family RNA polymerase sigma factor [Parcubacteria group bacterium]
MSSQDTNRSLRALVAEACDGKQDAFKEVFEHLYARVFRYVLSHTSARAGEREDALDITQEVFVDLWKSLNSFRYRSDEEFYGFVFRIVKRKVARFYKQQHKTKRDTAFLNEDVIDESAVTRHEDHRFLLKQIQTLAEKYQDLLRLRYWGGMKLAEAASVLNITEGTAKVWHHRALQELKTKVERL